MSADRQPPAGGLPRADLGKVFGVQDERRGRIGALLPTAPPAVPVERAAEPAPASTPEPAERVDVDQDQAPAELDQAPDVVEDQAAEQAGGDVDQDAATRTKPVIIYLPDRLRGRLRRAAIGSTQLDVMLDAVERTESAGILGRLVAEHQAPDTAGLFARKTPRGSGTNVQVNVRAMQQHIAVLDRLAARYNTNRSELVRVALDHVLPGGPRRRS